MKFQKVKPKSKSRMLRFNASIITLAVVMMIVLDYDPSIKRSITPDICLIFIIIFAAINFIMRLDTKHYLVSENEQAILFPDSYIEFMKASKRPVEH